MEVIIVAIAIFLNFWLLYWKITHRRIADAVLDASMMILLALLFGGTASGMASAMVGGALISIGLLLFPPNLNTLFGESTPDKPQERKPTKPNYPDWYVA